MFFLIIILVCAVSSIVIFQQYPHLDLELANYFFYAPLNTENYPVGATPSPTQWLMAKSLNTFFNGNNGGELKTGFFLQEHFIWNEVLHIYLKYILIFLAVAIVFQQILSIHRDNKFKIERRAAKSAWFNLAICLLAIALSTTLISILKSHSLHACPWDLAIYHQAKAMPWYDWQYIFSSQGAGRCFPAGHSSVGFLFMHFALLCGQDSKSSDYLKRQAKIKPWFWLTLGLFLGFLLGLAQQMRGAHFMSHTLTSMYIHLLIYGVFRYILILRHQKQAQSRFIV
jgi:membrane-associated PAP2 superfamily phosphatase